MAIRVDCRCGYSTVLADSDVATDVACPSCGETLSGQGFVHFPLRMFHSRNTLNSLSGTVYAARSCS